MTQTAGWGPMMEEQKEATAIDSLREICRQARSVPEAEIVALRDRCNEYLVNGGFFNPESMQHDRVRDLIIDVRDRLASLLGSESDQKKHERSR